MGWDGVGGENACVRWPWHTPQKLEEETGAGRAAGSHACCDQNQARQQSHARWDCSASTAAVGLADRAPAPFSPAPHVRAPKETQSPLALLTPLQTPFNPACVVGQAGGQAVCVVLKVRVAPGAGHHQIRGHAAAGGVGRGGGAVVVVVVCGGWACGEMRARVLARQPHRGSLPSTAARERRVTAAEVRVHSQRRGACPSSPDHGAQRTLPSRGLTPARPPRAWQRAGRPALAGPATQWHHRWPQTQ